MNVENALNTTSSPILTLPGDLLLVIFSINADMNNDFYDKHSAYLRALTITRHSSQVCHYWRELIVASSALWGRVIDLELLNQRNSNRWRNRVLRRARGALLHVKGYVSRSPMAPEIFLPSLLNDQWERITNLEIWMKTSNVMDSDQAWVVLQRPAPNLRFFHIYIQGLQHRKQILAPTRQSLFAGIAPSLHEFCSPQFAVDLRAPWLANLRKLEISQPSSFVQLLVALRNMPFLEYIQVEHPADGFSSIKSFHPVTLSRLQEIKITSSFGEAIFFLELVLPAPTCSLMIKTLSDLTEQLATHARRTITRYATNYFQSHSPDSLLLKTSCVFRSNSVFEFDARHSSSLDSNYFSLDFKISRAEPVPTEVITILLDTFSSCKLDEITRLDLCIKETPYSIYSSTLSTLVSLNALAASNDTLKCILEVSKDGAIVFPLVRTLMPTIVGEDFLNPNSVFSGSVIPFLNHRKLARVPIEILDLYFWARIKNFDPRPLDQVTGLKVRLRYKGKEVDYLCGSGKPNTLFALQRYEAGYR